MILTYGIITIVLIILELLYFQVADYLNIIDKPNQRSSHTTLVIRGGGVIFALSALVWCGLQAAHGDWHVIATHWPFLAGLVLAAGISFIDDLRTLSVRVRLVGQFGAMALACYQLGLFDSFQLSGCMLQNLILPLLIIILVLVSQVGALNVINFMDGINGITAGYSLAVLIPLSLINGHNQYFLRSLVATVLISVLVFCFFNFREKGRARCFAGDVGSVGIGYILLFLLSSVIIKTQDPTYLVFLSVYGVDGVLTIFHRIMLHENLGDAHRKHAYQIMSNELHMSHILVSSIYALIQVGISLGFIYLCPDNPVCHWMYLVGTLLILSVLYILFMKKYYHLHEDYLASLKK